MIISMEKLIRGKHFIKEWRKKRNISLRALANRLEVSEGGDSILSHASLGRIEKGEQPFTEETLNAIAFALDVDRADLLSKNPYKDGEIIDLLRRLDDKDRATALDMLKVFVSSRTG